MIKDPTFKVIPPKCLIPELLQTYHDETGHPGEIKAIDEIQQRYCWYDLKSDVRKFIQSCHSCQTSKPNLKPRHPPLGKSETPTQPYQIMAFDLTGPLQLTDLDNKYILVGIDLFSKKIYTAPLESKESHWISMEISKMLYSNPHLPEKILTDHGTEFSATSKFCNEHNIKHAKSPPYHPATNGAVERANQSLKQRLFAEGPTNDWDTKLARITHAINCSPNAVSGRSPFCVETGFSGKNTSDQNEQEPEIRQNTHEIQHEVFEKIQKEKENRVSRNAKDNFVPFGLGETVLVRNHVTKFPRYLGPHTIIGIRGNGLSYELQNIDNGKTSIRPVIDLKPYYRRTEGEARDQDMPRNDDSEPEVQHQQPDDDDDYSLDINFFVNTEDNQAGNANDEVAIDESVPTVSSKSPNSIEEPTLLKIPNQFENAEQGQEIQTENWAYEFGKYRATTPENQNIADKSVYVTPTGSADDTNSIESDSLEIPNEPETEIENASTNSDDLVQQELPRTPSPIEPPSTSPGKPSPKEKYPYKVKLYQMGDTEMNTLADQLKIPITGTISNKRRQIDEFFTEHRPEHVRTERGVLLFNCSFDPDEPRKIGSLSALELQAVIESYQLPKPSYLQKDRKSLQKHVQKQFLKKYPRANLKDGEILFGRSSEPKTTSKQ